MPQRSPSALQMSKEASLVTSAKVKWSKLNTYGLNSISPNFEEVAFKTPVGQMSDLIQTA